MKIENLLDKTKIYITRGYAMVRDLVNLVHDIIWIKLITKNMSFIHAACVSNNEEGYILNAWMGTGKTITTLKLIKLNKFNFLADDMTIIDDKGNCFAYPLPIKLGLEHSEIINIPRKVKLRLMLGKTIEKIPIVRRSFDNKWYVSIDKVLNREVIRHKAKISKVLIVKKAKRDYIRPISNEDAIKVLLHQNLWERISLTDRVFIPYSFADPGFDLNDIVKKEEEVIRKAISSAECLEIGYRDKAYDIICKCLT